MKYFDGTRCLYAFEPHMTPIGTVEPGERFRVTAHDCFREQIHSESQALSEIDYSLLNPATGPIYVAGAEPGDLLKICIHSIEIADRGIAMVVQGEGVLGDRVTPGMVKVIPIQNGFCRFAGRDYPIHAMIGVIGVAPSEASGTWGTASPWKHGGNMDTKEICAGTVLYLPVAAPGALLALGDCHGAMGDGELCFTGLEVQACVELTAEPMSGLSSEWPLLETSEAYLVIVSGDTVDHALREAASTAVDMLSRGLGLSFEEAYLLASLYVDLKISQIVDPKKTVKAVIPKTLMSQEHFLKALGSAP